MDVFKNFLKAKNPCADGFRWFLRHHPEGHGYQELLDELVAEGRVEDACWLLSQFGPTSAVRRLERLSAETVVFAGTIEVARDIDVGGLLRAGRDIRAGGAIRVGRALVAGGNVIAGGEIEAVSVEAGGDVQALSLSADAGVRVGARLRCTRDLVCRLDLDVGAQANVGGMLVAQGAVRVGRSLHVRGELRSGADLRVGDGVLAGADIVCGAHLEAGWGIKAGGDIGARGAIRAGESLQALGEIRAGAGYGVYAGLCVPQDDWDASARVSARDKPEQLLSGCWVSAEAAWA